MLLTIHNLPSHMRYVDIKSLINSKCGLTEIILDNLVNEGQFKKVTVGLSEEEDAALLVRQINGLFMEGQMLYVEDVRQKKASEQPYRSTKPATPNQSNQSQVNPWASAGPQQGYGFGMGYPNPFMQQDPSVMMSTQMMGGMYFMPPQNSFMEYGSQALHQSSNTSQFSQAIDTSRDNQQNSSDYYARNNNNQRDRDNDNRSRDWRYEDNDSYQQNRSQHNEPDRSRMSRWQNNDKEDGRERYRSRSPRGDQPRGRPASGDRYLENNSRSDHYDYRQQNITPPRNYPEVQRENANESYSNQNYDNNRQSKWDKPYVPPRPQKQEYRQTQSSYSPQTNNKPTKDEQWSNRRLDENSQKKKWDRQAPIDKNIQQQPRYSSAAPGGSMPRPNKRWENDAPRSAPAPYKPRPARYETRSSVAENKKPNSNSTSKIQKPMNYETLLRKDETWRHQASAKVKNEIIRKYQYPIGLPPTAVDKALKLAVHTRIDLILKGEMGVDMETIGLRYRKIFPVDGDKAFYDAVVENVRKEDSQRSKLEGDEKQGIAAGEAARPTTSAAATDVLKKEPKTEYTPAAVVKQVPNKQPEKPSDVGVVYNVPVQKRKPVPEPTLGRLPKYPQGNKKVYSEQKKAQKMEYMDDNLYQLDPPLAKALEEQLDRFCNLFKGELQNPSNESEVFVFEKLCKESVNSFRKAVKINLTKRILDIRTNLIVRVFVNGKPPKVAEVNEFMMKFGVISLKKSAGKKLFYTANLGTYEDYDRLCAMGSAIMNPNTALQFKPFQLTGPKQKPKRNESKAQRDQFIQSSDGDGNTNDADQEDEVYDATGEDDPNGEDVQEEFDNNENYGNEMYSDDHNVDEMIDEIVEDGDVVEDDNVNEMCEDECKVYEVKDEDLEDY